MVCRKTGLGVREDIREVSMMDDEHWIVLGKAFHSVLESLAKARRAPLAALHSKVRSCSWCTVLVYCSVPRYYAFTAVGNNRIAFSDTLWIQET